MFHITPPYDLMFLRQVDLVDLADFIIYLLQETLGIAW